MCCQSSCTMSSTQTINVRALCCLLVCRVCLCVCGFVVSFRYFGKEGGMDHLKRRLMLQPSCRVVDQHPSGDPLLFSVSGIDAHDSNSSEIELVLSAKDQGAKQLWVEKLLDCVRYVRTSVHPHVGDTKFKHVHAPVSVCPPSKWRGNIAHHKLT